MDDHIAEGSEVTSLAESLRGFGAAVTLVPTTADALRELVVRQPDVLISDLTRDNDPEAGFIGLVQFRESGYEGPAIFFATYLSDRREHRARELDAWITESPEYLVNLITKIAAPPAPKRRGAQPS
ncbi:hypothetical protein [Streptomyces sp. NPDC006463]|uniref:hypothetical protein n=1 Tax=Streptomyces sp. NPDC006463 TaxID=3364746 RepID=UPI0036BFBCEC